MLSGQQQIKEAGQRGLNWLSCQQNQDGSFGQWGMGSTCLAALALLGSNEAVYGQQVQKALAYLLTANAALDTRFHALRLIALVTGGKTDAPITETIRSDTAWLVQAQYRNPNGTLAYGGWGETLNPVSADGLSTQWAMLSLYLADRRGEPIPKEIWQRALAWYQQNYNTSQNGSYVYSLARDDINGNKGIVYSMTTAALASLKIIGLLAEHPKARGQAGKLAQLAVEWLEANYCVTWDSSFPDSWYGYYLCNLAIAGVIEPSSHYIGGYDWHAGIADVLLNLQHIDGSWASESDKKSTTVIHTSLALLALNKAGFVTRGWQREGMTVANNIHEGASSGNKISRGRRFLRRARLPLLKTLENFDFSHLPQVDASLIWRLGDCDFITKKENIVLIGNSGTGKTHLALAMALKACERGFSVRFYTAAELVNYLSLAETKRKYFKLLKRLQRYELLIIDELAYFTLSRTAAEQLFQILSGRCERGSAIITTSLDFSRWAEIFGDAMLTKALTDKLIHTSYVINTTGPSYREKLSIQRSLGKS